MNFQTILSPKTLTASMALLVMPLGYSQIPESELESIFERLNGSDYDVRYEARMDLQDHVSEATKPGNEPEIEQVEQQLLSRLQSEPLLTTRLWILRQLSSIGSERSIQPLTELSKSGNEKLADGARMALSRIVPAPSAEKGLYLSSDPDELERLAVRGENRSVRYAAFQKLVELNAKQAAQLLGEAVASDSPSATDFLKIAISADSRRLQKEALSRLSEAEVKHQIVILGGLESRVSGKIEKQLISLLESDNDTLKVQTVEALGRVGTVRSLAPVLSLANSRDKDLSSAAIDTLASIPDRRIDSKLLRAAKKGSVDDRITALNALSFRAPEGVTELVNQMASNSTLDQKLREAAIESMESVGDLNSLPVLVNIVVEGDSGLRRDAQRTLKRMTLRTNDAEAAWAAFSDGFDASSGNKDARLALMLVLDSAPSSAAIDYLRTAWESGDDELQKTVLKVLPAWRNWDGAYLLLDLAKVAGGDEKLANNCLKGIARVILGSDSSFPIPDKYKLANAALQMTDDPSTRNAILNGFRNASWQDLRYIGKNEVDPEIKAKVEGFVKG